MPKPFIMKDEKCGRMRRSRAAALISAGLLSLGTTATGQQARSLGIDVSAWQGSISTATWSTLHRATNSQVGGVYGDGRDFVMIRSSRGGTTGEDHRQGGYPSGNNTLYTYSQRYDDPYFVQNINRAINAGLFAGTYHFARPDVLATTLNSDGVTPAGVDNSGTDEANHMIQMASPWMRPGFLPPTLDLEAGDGARTDEQMTQFCIDFSDRIYAVMGIRPAIYINGNYAANILAGASASLRAKVVAGYPTLWSARWPNQTDPNSIDVQNSNPNDSYVNLYGPWDDSPNPPQPWKFWQYASTAHINSFGTANVDVDVAHGGIEFLKDTLIPAVWLINADGQWTTLTNWNSGQTPVTPVPGAGQLARVGTLTMPTPTLPSVNDTVVLDRTNVSFTVTLSSGTQNIRKLYLREALNITGGSLNINYVPSSDSTTFAAQFSGPVTLSGSGSLSVHTLQVEAAKTFTLNGGTLAFKTLNLMPGTTPAKLALGGDVIFNSVAGTIATITNGSGSGTSGSIDLTGGDRAFSVTSGVDLFATVPISNGALTKSGAGTTRLNNANTYSGGTTVSAGRLLVNNTSGSGTGSGGVTVNGGTLGGTGMIAGTVTVNSGGTISPGPGTAIGTLTLNSPPVFNGTSFVKIDRNGGASLGDKIVLSNGTLSFGGTLVVSNTGAAFLGGEMFTNFIAPAFAGAFAASVMPALNNGLNWYLGDLVPYGRIKVNRGPVAGPMSATNIPAGQLQIPIADLIAGATDADGDSVTLKGINLTSTNGVTLVTNDTFIFYSSTGNAADQINYTISDGHAGVANGAVTILPSTVGQFMAQPTMNGASTTIHFAGGPGLTYYVERSISLPDWTTISTNVMPPSGTLDFTDDFHDLSEPPASALYRLRW